MALMEFREKNRVKWVGVRPAHDGEEVAVNKLVTNTFGDVYVVPAGKTLHLISVSLGFSAIATGLVSVYLRPSAGGATYYFFESSIVVALPVQSEQWYAYPPLELSAGDSVRVSSGVAGLTVRASIFGWIE